MYVCEQHEGFRDRDTPGAYPNDIALLVPSEPIVLSDSVAPIRLDSEQSDSGCYISGWGRTEGTNSQTAAATSPAGAELKVRPVRQQLLYLWLGQN